MINYMDISKRIKAARERANFSQAALGRALGVKAQTVQQWESGETAPRRGRYEKLAEVLNVTPEWIQFGVGDSPTEYGGSPDSILIHENHSPEEQAWLDFYRRMNADQRKTARQIIEWCLNIVDTEMRYALEGKEKRRYYDKDNGK